MVSSGLPGWKSERTISQFVFAIILFVGEFEQLHINITTFEQALSCAKEKASTTPDTLARTYQVEYTRLGDVTIRTLFNISLFWKNLFYTSLPCHATLKGDPPIQPGTSRHYASFYVSTSFHTISMPLLWHKNLIWWRIYISSKWAKKRLPNMHLNSGGFAY